jgi:hypothetical protein
VGGSPNYVNIDCAWDTTAYPNDGGPSQNRPYVVRISAENAEKGAFAPPTTMHRDDRNVTVANPVSAPRDVRLGFSESNREATVGWRPNPEPDITSYIVQERVGDGPFKTVGQAGGKVTTFTRTLATAGTYRYQVAALRPAGSGNDSLQSAWTGPAAEPKQIVVTDPPRPSTTSTTAPYEAGNSGSGDPGANGGGSPPGAPAPGGSGVPAPATASGAANDPSASSTGANPPAEGSRSAALVTPIQAGAPGSVRSGGATTGNLTTAPTAKPAKATTTTEAEGPDPGFSPALPYQEGAPDSDKEDGQAMGRVLVGLPEAIGGESTRHLLVPLAAGLALFVFAMHAFYASRRAAVEAPLETE